MRENKRGIMESVISFSKYKLNVFALFFYILLSFLRFVTGAARFTQFPPSVLYVQTGQTARFVWDYTVDNRTNEFSLNSPLWAFYDSSNRRSVIGTEDGLDGWKWTLHNECPARLKTRVSIESTATLTISSVTTADNGIYGCSLVLIGLPDKTSTVRLIVTVPPRFNPQPPLTRRITEGQDLSLSCTAIGPPTPNITWVKMVGNNRVTKRTGTGSAKLSIQNIRRDQNGTYECQAKNNPNEKQPVTAQTVVTVYYPPSITTQPENYTVIQGKPITLFCNGNGYPVPVFRWLRSNGISPDTGNNLTIHNTVKSNTGKYTCLASNVYGGKQHNATINFYVTVKYNPSILNQSHDQIVNETDSLHLTCTADGYPPPNITWSKLPGTITPSFTTGNVYNIFSVNRSDAGTYTCTANNGIGTSARADIQVTVQYKPTIDVLHSTPNISSWIGNKVTLKCFAHGLPAPYFTWYMSGNQQITSGVTNVTNGSHVTTTTTKESIAYGSYKCEARNVAGFDEHLIYITQLFAPGLPNITMNEDDIKAVSITVRWTTPDYDGGTAVIDYKVQVNKTKTPKEKTTSNNQQDFTGLEKNTKYEVKVFARNKVGYGNPSIKIITTKKQGPPSSPDIELQSNQTAITLSWSKPDANGGEITKYTIYANGNRFVDVTSNSELKYVIDIKELTAGISYTFIVTAMNQYGESVKDQNKAKSIRIPEVTTPTTISTTDVITPDKEKRQDGASSSSPIVIAGAVGAVVLFIIAAVIAVIILRKKNLLGQGIKRSSKTNRATYHNDIDPDSGIHQGAVISLNDDAEGGIPTYAAVDISKKKNKAADIPNYAAVDMTKKKRPGEIIYAELADFNTAGTSAAEASRPITYTGTDYADISQFQKQDAPEATYANFPGRNKNFTNIQGM